MILKKRAKYRRSGISPVHTSMSVGLANPLEIPGQLRATLLIPIIDLSAAAKHMIDFMRSFTETLVNFVCLFPLQTFMSFSESLKELAMVAYFAMSAVKDTISALITLGTTTLGALPYTAMLVTGLVVGLSLYVCFATLQAAFSWGRTLLGHNEPLLTAEVGDGITINETEPNNLVPS